ncbi:serine/threonine-protein kinase [Haloferula sargassicola]|uniref:Serine/threonine-protein kinase PknD n=1 Tax=Haloferula sargassicola TaxID=490096 RepID=A0ABP9UMF6_9BACT
MSPPDPDSIAQCHACGADMDVSAVGPFTNVACPSCGGHTRVKTRFGPYTLTRRHAIGGMSMVFVAEDPTLGRELVVKILSETYSADEKRIAAFEEEARITASISHPHVVRVFTTGRSFGRFFIAMEFVPGGHFEHHIREREKIPEEEVLPLAIEVAEGLQAAKSAGLIHRDVKPGNILLDANGSAKLVDFGLALVTHGGKARASELWATPYYVPPETIEGFEEDFRSDIYAFGATFYHALAGKPPCDEESMDTTRLRKAKRDVKPLRKAAPWVTAGTASVIDRCMALDPAGRFASYDELIHALRAARNGEIVATATAGARRSRSRGRGTKAAMVAGACAALAVLVLGAKWMVSRPETEAPQVEPTAAVEEPEEMPVLETPDASIEVARAYRDAAQALEARDFDAARERFAAVRDHPDVLEPTGTWAAVDAVACAWLAGRSEEARRQLGAAREHVLGSPSVSGDLRQILDGQFSALAGIPPVRATADTGDAELDRLLAWLAALKDWDQGLFAPAAEGFGKVAEAHDDIHASIARDYLHDLALLEKSEPADFHVPPATARTLADDLEKVRSQLRTKGRGPFNLRAWQLSLERAARRQPEAASAPETSPGLPGETWPAIRGCRFTEAEALLAAWQPAGDRDPRIKALLLELIGEARDFLRDLGKRSLAADGEILARDGREFRQVLGGDVSGIEVADGEGQAVRLKWSEVAPDSVIALHRITANMDGDSAHRHEQAVAFDFLVGDQDRARAAALKIAAASPEFARTWNEVVETITPP